MVWQFYWIVFKSEHFMFVVYFLFVTFLKTNKQKNIVLSSCLRSEKKIEMTAPVLMKMQEGDRRFWEPAVYTMSFLLPAEHQKNPPKPTDDKASFSDKTWHSVFILVIITPIMSLLAALADNETLLTCRCTSRKCQLWKCMYRATEDGWVACPTKTKLTVCPPPWT